MMEGGTPITEPSCSASESPAQPEQAKSSSSVITLSLGQENDFVWESSFGTPVIKCPCGNDEDDSFAVQCEKCSAWHHARCVGFIAEGPLICVSLQGLCKDSNRLKPLTLSCMNLLFSSRNDNFQLQVAFQGGPKKKRGMMKEALHPFHVPSSPSTISMTEIGENIVENDVLVLDGCFETRTIEEAICNKDE